MRNLIKLSRLLLLVIALSLLTACQSAPLDIHYYLSNEADFSQYQTFSVSPINSQNGRMIPKVTLGIERAMLAKGYSVAAEPDLQVLYQVHVSESEKLKSEVIPVPGNVFNRTTLEAVYEAKLLVNIVDAKTSQMLWKASTIRDLTQVRRKNETQEQVDQRIAEVFASFPERYSSMDLRLFY